MRCGQAEEYPFVERNRAWAKMKCGPAHYVVDAVDNVSKRAWHV